MSPPAFETIMPEIKSRSCRHYSHLNPAARDEAVQESMCQAWNLYHSAVQRGNHRFTPCTLAWFATRAVDEGRRFAGYTTTDALDRAIGFDDLDSDGLDRIARALVQRQTPVFHQARIRVDWPEFVRDDLTERECDITTKLAEGWQRIEIARYLGLSPARVTQILDGIGETYSARFGLPGFERRAREEGRRRAPGGIRRCRAVA